MIDLQEVHSAANVFDVLVFLALAILAGLFIGALLQASHIYWKQNKGSLKTDTVAEERKWLLTKVIATGLALLASVVYLGWETDRSAPSAEESEQVFTEQLREQYDVSHVVPVPATGTIGSYWGSFVKQAAAADGPAGAPIARIYNEDGAGHIYRVSFDNETGEIELFSDRDTESTLGGATRDPSYPLPSELRK